MKKPIMLKTIAKFFLFGAVLAVAAPYIGSVAGLSPTVEGARGELGKMGDPLLVGLFFAGLGALDAFLKPLFAKWFATPPSDGAP